MNYNIYLFLLHQLSFKKKAQCVVQGNVIFIEAKPKTKYWEISTKLVDGQLQKIPSFLKDSLTSRGILKWQERGAYLRLDPFSNHLHLIQDVRASNQYIPLKHLINDFVKVVMEWKNLIENSQIPEKEMLAAY
jgi:hypothetical protein